MLLKRMLCDQKKIEQIRSLFKQYWNHIWLNQYIEIQFYDTQLHAPLNIYNQHHNANIN